jgi:lipopolysaccharide export system permease protein
MLRKMRTGGGGGAEDRYDFWYRIAAPWACLVITLFSIPAGITTGRQSVFKGILLVLVTFFSFYAFTLLLKYFGQHGALSRVLAAWLPNLVFLAIGGAMYRRLT